MRPLILRSFGGRGQLDALLAEIDRQLEEALAADALALCLLHRAAAGGKP